MTSATVNRQLIVIKGTKTLYDELLYTGKPSLVSYGLQEFPLYYEANLFPTGSQVPNEAKVREAAQSLIASGYPIHEPVGLDVEFWNWHIMQVSQAEATAAMDNLTLIIDWFKDEAPAYTKVGYYSVGPNREYWAPQSPALPAYAEWQASNDFLAPIISHQLALYPSIYTFYNDPAGWVIYANANMNEAVRIAGGKPIYPFIWPQYHGGGDMPGIYIDYDFWTLHLETLAAHPGTSGIVIWGGIGYPYPEAGFETWASQANAPWWQATQDFLAP